MTDQTSNPLQQAQQLATNLQAQAPTLDAAALQSELARLSKLISQSEDASSVRQQLDQYIDDVASFTSLMVHEIRKPMTTIRGYSDMLAKPGLIGALNEQQQMFIDTIRTNVIRMEGLVSDISDINKLRSGRMRLDIKMTTFSQIILEVQKLAEPLIAETQQTVTWEIPQGLPVLNTDSKQVAKIVLNLLKNAILYTPKGGSITVKAARQDGNTLYVAVTDNGIGMKQEDIARLGEPFFRADDELVTSQRGYGLGIPVAMGFLALLNSKLSVESEVGKGSVFSFLLTGIG